MSVQPPRSFGVLVPPLNPTVEPELRALLPLPIDLTFGRLISSAQDLRQRLIDYFETLDSAVSSLGEGTFETIGFACTGSSYLIDGETEKRALAAVSARRGVRIVTAAGAIRQHLESVGARRMALVSPYPEWLTELSCAYWISVGFEIGEVVQISAPAGIYALSAEKVADAAATLAGSKADAILLTGTGAPTLAAIDNLAAHLGDRVVSSNLCLARAMTAPMP